ncbi:MAG: hypothetical protein ACQGVC_24805 [Myxococcota bacterium]
MTPLTPDERAALVERLEKAAAAVESWSEFGTDKRMREAAAQIEADGREIEAAEAAASKVGNPKWSAAKNILQIAAAYDGAFKRMLRAEAARDELAEALEHVLDVAAPRAAPTSPVWGIVGRARATLAKHRGSGSRDPEKE